MINDKLTSSLAEAYKKMKQEELKGDQHKIDANKNGEIDAHDFKLLRAKNEETEPKSEEEKNLAALGHPKDKVTHKDVLIGRGVLKKEGWDSKKHAVSEQEEPRRIPEKDKEEPLMPKKPTTLGGELAMKAVQRIISKHKTNEENEPRKIPEKDKEEPVMPKKPTTLGAELAMKDVEKMVAKNKTANEEPVNELGPETLISYAMKAKGQERPGIVNPRRDAMVDLAVKKASASAKPINNSYVPEEKEDAPFAGPYGKMPQKQKDQKSNPSMSRARHLARQAMQNLAQKKKDQKVAEEFVLEGKMGQLHADIGDHLDKHIKDYNAGNLGHDSFGEKVVDAHKKIADLHGISQDAAKKHVNDYVDQHMKEEVKEPTGDLKDACWKGYTAVGLKKKGGRMVPNCVPKKEEVELNEGNDDVGEMIKDKLKIIINRAKEMHDGIGPNTDMPEWVKSKITLAQDYVSTACDYSCGSEQLGEEVELDEAMNVSSDNQGTFKHAETKKYFTYKNTNDPWAKKHGLPHEIHVGPNGKDTRFGHVKGSVAHVAVDERSDGGPEIEKWKITNHERKINEDMETPDIKVRKTYTDAYADHYKRALKLNSKGASKRAEAMAYDTVKMKHGDDAHDALKAYHEKNQNESYEQIDEELSSRAKLVKELYNKAKEEKKSKKDKFDPEPEMEIMPSPRYSQPKR